MNFIETDADPGLTWSGPTYLLILIMHHLTQSFIANKPVNSNRNQWPLQIPLSFHQLATVY